MSLITGFQDATEDAQMGALEDSSPALKHFFSNLKNGGRRRIVVTEAPASEPLPQAHRQAQPRWQAGRLTRLL